LLIEKRKKGEGKSCGGAIPSKEAELFGKLPDGIYDFPVKRAVIKSLEAGDLVLDLTRSGVDGYGVKREIYDTYLMERAQNAGGKIHFQECVTGVEFSGQSTVVVTDKGKYASRFVFVALGHNGLKFLKYAGLEKYPYRKGGVAVQNVLRGEYFKDPDTLVFHSLPEILRSGYFWVFPKKGFTYVGCGLAVEDLGRKNLHGILNTFVEKQFGAPSVFRREWGFIPFFAPDIRYGQNIFFLGDSAGLANPLHGGGIFEARLSGKHAAEAVLQHHRDRAVAPGPLYCKHIEADILEYSNIWDAQMKRLLAAPAGRKKFWELSIADQDVRDAVGFFFSSSESHFVALKSIIEKVFQAMQEQLEKIIRPYRDLIDCQLSGLFKQQNVLNDLVNYSLLAPGKRLRSALVLLMTEIFGGEISRALPAAVSYELAHTASLVHDDVIDKAEKRRGQHSVVSRFGVDSAIVSGDALLIKAYEIISQYRNINLSKDDLIDLITVASRSGIMACQGELLDGTMGGAPEQRSVADYIGLVRLKTAALIEGPCEAAAILAGHAELRKTAGMFGRFLGIAFQILDDSKDIFSCETSTLKGRFADFINGKPNIYILWMLKKACGEDLNRLHHILTRGEFEDNDIMFLYKLGEVSGVFKRVKRLCRAYLRKAAGILEGFPDGQGKRKLSGLLEAIGFWTHF
jgi:geranylgeranyl pyrophosphate synthase